MAETIVDSLLSWLSPRSAEAKVTPTDAQAAEYLRNIETQNAPDLDAYRKLVYQTVLQKAQAEPAETRVGMTPQPESQYGQYNRKTGEIGLSTRLPQWQAEGRVDPKTIATHELLHFLSQQYGYAPWDDARQHQMIDYVLGPRRMTMTMGENDWRTTMGEPMSQGSPETASRQGQQFLRRLWAGTPLESGSLGRPRDASPGGGPDLEMSEPPGWSPYQADWLGAQGGR